MLRGVYFVHSLFCYVNENYVKVLRWSFSDGYISQQLLIRKHLYLGHAYLRGSAYIPWILAQESMPQGGTGGENLAHPKKVLYCFFFYDYHFLRH